MNTKFFLLITLFSCTHLSAQDTTITAQKVGLGTLLAQAAIALEQKIKEGGETDFLNAQEYDTACATILHLMGKTIPVTRSRINIAQNKHTLKKLWLGSIQEITEKLKRGIREDKISLRLNQFAIDTLNDLPQSMQDSILASRGGSPLGVFLGFVVSPIVLLTSLIRFGIGLPLSMIPVIGNVLAFPFVTVGQLGDTLFNFLLGTDQPS